MLKMCRTIFIRNDYELIFIEFYGFNYLNKIHFISVVYLHIT